MIVKYRKDLEWQKKTDPNKRSLIDIEYVVVLNEI